MVEIFNHHFVDSVETITRCFPPAYTNVCPVTTVEPVFRIRPVDDSDVMRTIRSLKSSRAKDKYGMDVVMLKESSLTLIKPITKVINLSISQGKFPSVWMFQ